MKSFTIRPLFLMAFIAISALSPKAAQANECSQVKHFILIHGIGGNASSFGAMNKSLEKNIECSKAYFYEYDTANSRLKVKDFAKGLTKFIKDIPRAKAPLKAKDINLIMHSQGGLIGFTWIKNSLEEMDGFSLEQAKRLSRFVTLSTPFWGSDFALLGEKFFFSLGVKDNVLSPFGETQLMDMKYGSLMMQELLDSTSNNKKLKNFFEKEVASLNVSAMIPVFDRIFHWSPTQFFEGDLIVNIPSMKLNFLYGTASGEYLDGEESIVPLKRVKFGEQAYAYGTHLEEVGIGQGIVDVPEECIDMEDCYHPGQNVLMDFLKDGEVSSNNGIKNRIKGFDIQVKVEVPKGFSSHDTKILPSRNGKDIAYAGYRFNLVYSKPINSQENSAFFLIKGSILSSNEKESIKLILKHPDLKERELEVEVEKGSMTYLKAELLP